MEICKDTLLGCATTRYSSSKIIGSKEPDNIAYLGTTICSHGLLKASNQIRLFITDSTATRQLEKKIT
jgi:hypothetical protein